MKKMVLALMSLLLAPIMAFALAAVDLNSAPPDQLEKLPGVGKATAQAIVAKRPFKSVDELKDVKGIGEAKFAKLKSLVMVAPEEPAPKTVTSATGKTIEPQTMKPGETLNVNTASASDLQKLPGIGPEKAKAIIAGRPFAKVEDLSKVKGIKGATMAKIKPFVTTN